MPVSWTPVTAVVVMATICASICVSVWAAFRIWGGLPPRGACEALSRREMAFLEAVADATFPEGGPVAPSGTGAGIPAYADRYAAAVPAATRRLMRALYFLVEHATLFFPASAPGGHRRFSSLSPEQRVEVLDAWRTSSLFPRRLVFQSLRAILTMAYFADPEVLATLGLTPREITPPIVEADLLYPPVGQPKSAIRHRAVDPRAGDVTPLRPADPPAPHGGRPS